MKVAKMIGNRYMLLWSGGCKPENGVGAIVANWLVEKTMEVERPTSRIIKAKVTIDDEVWEVISCYCPKVGRQLLKRMSFMKFWTKLHPAKKAFTGGDFNGHGGSEASGFTKVHGVMRLVL